MALAKVERERASRAEGALGKAADDEPVFILRGQDKLAAGLVGMWAELADLHCCPPTKVAEARQLAELMRRWPIRKYPD